MARIFCHVWLYKNCYCRGGGESETGEIIQNPNIFLKFVNKCSRKVVENIKKIPLTTSCT